MASKSAQQEPEKAEVIEEALDTLETALDRVKVLYEQYFLGIAKQPPTYLHTDVERKLRDLAQMQIRNTALRYRFATAQQKFGAYSGYWRRTLRQIENGKYARNLSKIGRQAAKSGEEIPEEILAAMPKRMREQVRRDREAALAIAARRHNDELEPELELLTLMPEAAEPAHAADDPTLKSRPMLDRDGAYRLDEADDFDISAILASVLEETEDEATGPVPVLPKPAPPAPLRAASLGASARTPATPAPVVPQPAPRAVVPQPVPRAVVPQPARPGQPTPTAGLPYAPTQAIPRITPSQAPTQAMPRIPDPNAQTHAMPKIPSSPFAKTQAMPRVPPPVRPPPVPVAPSQVTKPNPIAAGASTTRGPVPVETMSGPFPREPVPKVPRAPHDAPTLRPPPGMTDADVNALYAKYVKAKEAVGETTGPGAYGKLLKTINAQAPKIMEQYKAKGVDFSVVVKDNQVIIRAKPKT